MMGMKGASFKGLLIHLQRCSPLCEHNCINDITTSAQEHFVKPISANTVRLEIIASWFYLCLTQRPKFWQSGLYKISGLALTSTHWLST